MKRTARGDDGTILILCLIIVALVAVLVADAQLVARVEREASTNADYDLVLDYALRGGLEIAKAYLVNDKDTSAETDHLFEEWANPDGITRTLDPEAEGTDPYGYGGAEEEGKAPKIRIFIEDEERKWPLHLLTMGSKERKRRAQEGLANLIDEFRKGTRFDVDAGAADDIANKIAQFVTRKEGEDLGATPRPLTKSGCLLSTTDLALIPDLDPSLIFDQVDSEGAEGAQIVPGLINFVTLWSDLVINVNTAPEAVLQGLFRRREWNVGHDIFIARDEKSEELENPEEETRSQRRRREEREAEARARGTGATGREGEGGEEESGGGAPFNTVDEVKEAVPTLVTRIFNETRTIMTVKSTVFSVWVEATYAGVKRTRRWVLRQEGPRFLLILSELVDFPHYRPMTQDEADNTPFPR